jgi:hypothetical protein
VGEHGGVEIKWSEKQSCIFGVVYPIKMFAKSKLQDYGVSKTIDSLLLTLGGITP